MTRAGNTTIMALDVGERRIGVALTSNLARLPQPLTTLQNSAEIFDEIQKLVIEHQVSDIVVGRPRNLSGQATAQTKTIEAFTSQLQETIDVAVHLQDEAVTSAQAEAELRAKGKPFNKGDIDALAATYILEDYLNEHAEVSHA